jgi:hypothetical protein
VIALFELTMFVLAEKNWSMGLIFVLFIFFQSVADCGIRNAV